MKFTERELVLIKEGLENTLRYGEEEDSVEIVELLEKIESQE